MDLESIRAKIRALLQKTTENGCTEEEAFSALEKARSMMDAYEVTPDQLELNKDECVLIRPTAKGYDPRGVKSYLLAHIGAFCDCKFWWVSATQEFKFCGYAPDAEFAAWLLDSLHQFVMNELAAHLMTNPVPSQMKPRVISSFVFGATTRIGERMRAIKEQSKSVVTSNGRALVVAKDKAVRSCMRQAGIHLKSRSRRIQTNADAYGAGKSAGDRASFGRPVSGPNGIARLK